MSDHHDEAKIMKFWNVARRFARGGAWLAGAWCLVMPAFAQRVTLNFNPDWKFIKDDPAGAQAPAFNDSNWTEVSAPHTYNNLGEQNTWGGRTWYRKTFTLPKSEEGKKVYLEFEAVRQVAEVYLDGKLLGTSKTGFIPFGFDLTPYVQFGRTNVLAVMCDNRFRKDSGGVQINSLPTGNSTTNQPKVDSAIPESIEELRANQIPWNNSFQLSADGGIFRNVRLYVLDPLHISLPLYSFLQTAGPYVYAQENSAKSARVNVEVPIENNRRTGEKVELVAEVLDRNGVAALTMRHEVQVVAGASAKFNLSGILPKPELWESDYPYLYRVVCALKVNGQTVDSTEIPLGIRTVKWTNDQGLFVNGHHEKLHGWLQKSTDEWTGLGAAQPDWMHFFTLNLMKEAGGNWVRWGYCAGGPEMISACDQLGLMVEQPGVGSASDTTGAAWELRASAFRDLIVYYRNHPSILVWEGGSEKMTREQAAELHAYVTAYDPHGGRAYAQGDGNDGDFMDLSLGFEGSWNLKKLPAVEGGYNREISPRGIWGDSSHSEKILASEQYAVNQMAQYLKKIGMPEHSGGANWIFSDTTSGGLGTAGVDGTSGEVDAVRLPKEAYYVCRAMFDARHPQVHIIGHWNYSAGTKKTICVASNCQRVELFVNGKSLGFGKLTADGPYIFTFPDVAWEPGEIKAMALSGGKIAAMHSLQTAGPAVALRLNSIVNPIGGLRADGSDVALIDVEAVDAKGERCPTFQQRVDLEIRGEGIWRGGHNSGKTNSISNTFLNLECGINRVAMRATRTAGKITIKATCVGLKPAMLSLKSNPFKTYNGFATELVMPEASMPVVRPAITSGWDEPQIPHD
jgi:beta-galactosidase